MSTDHLFKRKTQEAINAEKRFNRKYSDYNKRKEEEIKIKKLQEEFLKDRNENTK